MLKARSVFLVSPIGSEDSKEREHADKLLKHIIGPVCNKLDLFVERADHISVPGRINEQIARKLVHSDLIIADLTGLNSNVMYEVGVRHGLRLPIVQVAAVSTNLPFDLVDVRTVFYKLSLDNLEIAREALEKSIVDSLNGQGLPFISTSDTASGPYSGLNISGPWKVLFPDQRHRREITLDLTHESGKITGISTHMKESDEIRGDSIRTYELEGRVYNRFVLINGICTNPQRLGINSFLLEITGDGQMMRGQVTAYSTVNLDVFSLKCEVVRLADITI